LSEFEETLRDNDPDNAPLLKYLFEVSNEGGAHQFYTNLNQSIGSITERLTNLDSGIDWDKLDPKMARKYQHKINQAFEDRMMFNNFEVNEESFSQWLAIKRKIYDEIKAELIKKT
jgi:intergrase/recombinase